MKNAALAILLISIIIACKPAGYGKKLDGFWGLRFGMGIDDVKEYVAKNNKAVFDTEINHQYLEYRMAKFGNIDYANVDLVFAQNKLCKGIVEMHAWGIDTQKTASAFLDAGQSLIAKYGQPNSKDSILYNNIIEKRWQWLFDDNRRLALKQGGVFLLRIVYTDKNLTSADEIESPMDSIFDHLKKYDAPKPQDRKLKDY